MRLHLVDGTYELFRAHYSKRPGHTDPEGRDRKATVGLVTSLLGLLHDTDEDVSHIAVAFDNPIRSFRNRLLASYKDESGVPEELLAQFDAAERAAAALGLVVWSMDDYEADDALATAVTRWAPAADQTRDPGAVDQIRIMTPDKDLGQCVDGTAVVLVDRMRGRIIDESALRERRGVAPASIPDFLGLVGDRADGIPGLGGFGEKTAAALLGRYGHVDDIPDDGWDVDVRGAERLAATLTDRRDELRLYVRLATLITDVPLDETLRDLAWQGVPRGRFAEWCRHVGTDLFDRPTRWAADEPTDAVR